MTESKDDLPQSQNQRIVFIVVVSLFCLGLYFADYGLNALIEEAKSDSSKRQLSIMTSVIENLIAGAIAAVLLALAYRWIVNWIEPGDRVIEVPPGQITDRLMRNARSTRSYVFIGNTASFVSTSVLPVLVETARTSGHPKTVTLFLIDPINGAAVDAYVSYRARVAKGAYKVADTELAMWSLPQSKKIDSPDEVVAKILATFYIAAYAALHPGVNIVIYLRGSFTPFRADISDREAVLTQESALESAVVFSSRGHFYGWYHKEADAQKGQGEPFNLTASRDDLRMLNLAHPTAARSTIESSLSALLSHFGYFAPLMQKSAVIAKAAELIGRPKGQYL